MSSARPFDLTDPQSILSFGRRVIGLTARQICSLAGRGDPSKRPGWRDTKNVLGDVMEWYFGIPKNNSREPDFPLAKVELKVVPLKRKKHELAIKEPTTISMIDYMALVDESWNTASVRKKLDHILFVFYSIRTEDILMSRVRDVVLWQPSPADRIVFEADWMRARERVERGEAHLLSESQADALAARRKGPGGPNERGRPQPRNPTLAKSRAWALKTGFTRQILEEWVLHKTFESAIEPAPSTLPIPLISHIQERVTQALGPFVGHTLADLAARHGIPLSDRKNLAANIVKRALGFKSVNSRIREFDQFGIQVRTLYLRAEDGRPYEAVSFPAVDLRDLVNQDWEGTEDADGKVVREGCDLAEQLHLLLFVPTYSARRHSPQQTRILGRPFFWAPSPEQLQVIRQEWEMYRREVSEGGAAYVLISGKKVRRSQLTPATRTIAIHMRPHGQNSKDTYLDPKGNRVTKLSFWLNTDFVWRLVKENGAFPPPSLVAV